MKKFIVLCFTVTCSCFVYAQKKNYISIELGVTFTGMSNDVFSSMESNGFNATEHYDLGWLFLGIFGSIPGSTSYPIQDPQTGNNRIRYGYHLNNKTSIEAGFGRIYRTTVKGSNGTNDYYNHLDIHCKLSSFYVAWMWKTKKENAAIGIGPAISICNINQETYSSPVALSNKTQLLPGANITAYWNFINQKSWFMALRTDMSITAPATVESVTIIHPADNSIASVTKTASISTLMNTISVAIGIKF